MKYKKMQYMLSGKKWVIFYQKNKVNYYFVKRYKIGRLKFSKSKITTFKDVMEVNQTLMKISLDFKLYFPQHKLMCGAFDIK